MIRNYIYGLFAIFNNISIVLASIGLVLGTASFISGLQLVRGALFIEKKIHRFNGIATISLYVILAILSFYNHGVHILPLVGWLLGLCVILLKLSIVRARKRRSFKYASWLGATLILMWLYLVYIHIPY